VLRLVIIVKGWGADNKVAQVAPAFRARRTFLYMNSVSNSGIIQLLSLLRRSEVPATVSSDILEPSGPPFY
jgi:hypothetical protein